MPRVYVGIGSNIDREQNIRGALRELTQHYGVLALSPVYQSAAQGFDGADFYNLVAAFDTVESIVQIKQVLSRIEAQFGRRRKAQRFSARTLDLDLLLYGDTVQRERGVNLPHPDIEKYAFVLRPLAELAPQARHPETGVSYAEMWRRFGGETQDLRPVEFAFTP